MVATFVYLTLAHVTLTAVTRETTLAWVQLRRVQRIKISREGKLASTLRAAVIQLCLHMKKKVAETNRRVQVSPTPVMSVLCVQGQWSSFSRK